MNTEQENFKRQCERSVFKVISIQSGGKRCGMPDDMRAAINWRQKFKKMGYVPCLE